MGLPLISMSEFQKVLGMKCSYRGHVWDEYGNLFRVESKKQPIILSQPDYPNQNSRRYTNRDVFHTSRDTMTITLQEIGDDDVVYDEQGTFLETKKNTNDRKGEIYIRKKLSKPRVHVLKEPQYYEDVLLKSAGLKVSLSPEAYSRMFTHILSLDKGIKKDLNRIRNGEVSVHLLTAPKHSLYNITESEKTRSPSSANAYAKSEEKLVVALFSPGGDKEMYSTIWNVLNLLGVHEMGHVIYPWWTTDNHAHFLNYLYQMYHPTWKNTTKEFKKGAEGNLNYYYKRNWGFIGDGNTTALENAKILHKKGLYPAGTHPEGDIYFGRIYGPDSIRANERIGNILQRRTISEDSPFPER